MNQVFGSGGEADEQARLKLQFDELSKAKGESDESENLFDKNLQS